MRPRLSLLPIVWLLLAESASAAPFVQPRIVVSVALDLEPRLRSRIESELRASKATLSAEQYLAKDAIGALNYFLPLFAFVAGPSEGAVANLAIALEPLNASVWPLGDVGMKLGLQARGGAMIPLWLTSIKVMDSKLEADSVTEASFLRPRLEEFLSKWPGELGAAVARIPIPIPAKVGPEGVQTDAAYRELSPDFCNDQAVFRVQLDVDGHVDRFRACNSEHLAGPFVDDKELSCEAVLARGARVKPKGPGGPGRWIWPYIYLERFWRIPPN
jgi:hypothetical protein